MIKQTSLCVWVAFSIVAASFSEDICLPSTQSATLYALGGIAASILSASESSAASISLFEGERNAFFEPGGQYGLSLTGRQFMAGLLLHAREITAVTNQHVNSYKRLWGGGEAPCYVCWGPNNQSALIRLPEYKPSKPSSARIEYRSPDSAANPYLTFAVMLRAGLAGIENGYELPEPADSDVFLMSDMERSAAGIASLPSTLARALDVMEQSELVADTLGEACFDYFVREKRHEWQQYDQQITDEERRRFLTQF